MGAPPPVEGQAAGPPALGAHERERALAWARDELVRLVEIASPSGDEAAIVEYLERRAAELSLPVRRDPVADGRDNLIVGWPREPQVAVIAHVDTVKPTWEWDGEASVRGDEVWGLGAVDDKGSVVAALLGLRLARESGVPVADLPLSVGLTIDEEEGGTGSIALAKSLRARHAVVLESTGFDIAVAEAGVVEVVLAVHGRSAHGSVPEQGDNAVVKAAHMVVALEELAFVRRVHPLVAPAVTVQQMHGGSELHVVPDLTEVHLDVRLGPNLRAQEVFDELAELAGRFGADVRTIELADAWETPGDAPFVDTLRRAVAETLGHTPELFGFPAWTDAHNMVELGGSQAAVFGPGPRLSTAHRPDDHIDLSEVVDCALVLRCLAWDLWRAGDAWPARGARTAASR
jgi:acetylornithine deacetylase/succinyl-diaminopimelate desuccinylase-like protein